MFLAITAFLGAGTGTFLSTQIGEKPLELFFGIVLSLFTCPLYLERSSRQKRQLAKTKANEPSEPLVHPFSAGTSKEIELIVLGFASGLTAGLFGVSGAATLVVGLFLLGIPFQMWLQGLPCLFYCLKPYLPSVGTQPSVPFSLGACCYFNAWKKHRWQ